MHIGLNRTPFENVTPYPNRHKDLDNLCLYVFSSRFEKIPVDRIPSKDKTLHEMGLNAGVSPDLKYYMFMEDYSGANTHVLHRFHKQRIPQLYITRIPDKKSLYFNDSEGYSSLSPKEKGNVVKKRIQYCSMVCVLFYPWRSIDCFEKANDESWVDVYIRLSRQDAFSNQSLEFMSNIQQYHTAFGSDELTKEEVELAGMTEMMPDSILYDQVENCIMIDDQMDVKDEKESTATIYLEDENHVFLLREDSLLHELKDVCTRPETISQTKSSKEKTENCVFKPFPALGTQTFRINLRRIINIKQYSDHGIEFNEVPEPAEGKYPAIKDHARRWTLNQEQFVPFSIYCLKLLCRIHQNLPANILTTRESRKITRIQKDIFRDTSLRHMITAGAGCGKSRVLKAYMDFADRWDCLNRIKVTATTGKAAILLSGASPGRTYHSVLGFLGQYGKVRKITNRDKGLWKGIWQIIIDEVSMLSCEHLQKIHLRLKNLCDFNCLLGGLDLIVSGDFY